MPIGKCYDNCQEGRDKQNIVTNMPGARQRSCKHLPRIMGAGFSIKCYTSFLSNTRMLATGGVFCVVREDELIGGKLPVVK
jgi:hypothetical protein